MGKAIISGGAIMTVPSTDAPLSDVAVGSIVYLNESGSPVEFYVAKHDYESGLNGTGRTLLVRKDCHSSVAWDAGNVNEYSGSDFDVWFNGTYKALLDSYIRTAIGTTKFYYTGKGQGTSTPVSTLSQAIFALSVTELGFSHNVANVEGSALPIASLLDPAYMNGNQVNQGVRTPNRNYTNQTLYVQPGGNVMTGNSSWTQNARPAFTLPATAVVQTDGTIKL